LNIGNIPLRKIKTLSHICSPCIAGSV